MIDLYVPPKPAIIQPGEPWERRALAELEKRGVPLRVRLAVVAELERLRGAKPAIVRAAAADLERYSKIAPFALGSMVVNPYLFASDFSNTRSLDFESGSSHNLSRAWGAGGTSRRLMTWSIWYKRESTDAAMVLFAGGEDSSDNEFAIDIQSGNTLRVLALIGGSYALQKISTATFTDTASWHHLVVAVDTTQATADNRVRVYHDGTEITSWGTNTIWAQNTDSPINGYNTTYNIGVLNYSAVSYYDGLLDEFIFVDGQQLTPSSFASGATTPKAYAGTYGTKGFRLRFEDTGDLGNDDSGNNNDWTLNGPPVTSTDHP